MNFYINILHERIGLLQELWLDDSYSTTVKLRVISEASFYLKQKATKGGGADVPLFETIKTNAGTQPKNESQQ